MTTTTTNRDNKTAAAGAAIIYSLFCMAAVIAAAVSSNAESMTPSGSGSGSGSSGETPVCNGTMGECGADGEEFLMESEISRRFLQAGGHIDYDALKANQQVCNPGPGMSFGGNCLPPPSNSPRPGPSCYKNYYRC